MAPPETRTETLSGFLFMAQGLGRGAVAAGGGGHRLPAASKYSLVACREDVHTDP